MNTSLPIIQVALPTPAGDWFDYLPGELPYALLQPGCRVRVSFGKRQLVGMVVGQASRSALPISQLKTISSRIDDSPLLPPAMLLLMQRAAAYYHHPLGEVIFTALPAKLREGALSESTSLKVWRATTEGLAFDLEQLSRAPRQRLCLDLLRRHSQGLSEDTLNQQLENWRSAVRALADKKLVSLQMLPCLPEKVFPPDTPPVLNESQQAAVEALETQTEGFTTTLLQGVTGSGKTEVYLRVIENIIAAGKQALVLVPEISLTPQLLQRFQSRLGHRVVTLHSALNDTERLCAWHLSANGQAHVIIGTRSTVFVPMRYPGVIIVDEEHDSSYKQQEGFRYHARDLAILRGQLETIPVVLGSATPSLESLYNVQQNKYRLLHLPERAGESTPPHFQLVDLRRQQLTAGLSTPLVLAIREALAQQQQVLLFINRRGFAPAMLCHDCGHIFDCPRCDAHTTFHARSRELRCHHCGHIAKAPKSCPSCQGKNLVTTGVGTEQIEQQIQALFPKHRCIRIDRDSMQRKNALQQALDAIADKQYDIIIGTQLLTKGHHFPDITLVGMIDVDQGLYSVDFHAPEKLAQQIVQVAGRAGRGDQPGKVLIQTHQPEHPLLISLLQQGFESFSRTQLQLREQSQLPPFSHLALLRSAAVKREDAENFLQQCAAIFNRQAQNDVLILGPVAAPMEKRAGRFRQQLLLESRSRNHLHQLLKKALPEIRGLKTSRKVRWSLDIDPVEMD